MSEWDAAGLLASGLVIAAFCMRGIVSLRAIALASNVAFLVYGIGLNLVPVWLLHAILLPLNSWRLWQSLRRRRRLPEAVEAAARDAGIRNGQSLHGGSAQRGIELRLQPGAPFHGNPAVSPIRRHWLSRARVADCADRGRVTE